MKIIWVLLVVLGVIDLIVYFTAAHYILSTSGYLVYFNDILIVFAALALGYLVIGILTGLIGRYAYRRVDAAGSRVAIFVAKAILYIALAFLILGLLGISPTTLTYGGAVVGVILGLVLQSLAPMMLSGVLINSTKTLATGDTVMIESSIWGVTNPKFCKIKKVGLIFTDVYNPNGSITRIPNIVILNSAISTKYDSRSSTSVTVRNDVSLEDFEACLNRNMKNYFKGAKSKLPESRIAQSGEKTFTYNVTFYFNDIDEIDDSVHRIFQCFDKSYQEAKEAVRRKR